MRNFLDVVNYLGVNPAYGLELRSSSTSPKPPKRSARPAKRTNSERVIRSASTASGLASSAQRPALRRRSTSRRRTLAGGTLGGGVLGGGGGGSSSGDPSSDEENDNEFVLLRNFSLTCKGVVNRGDSVRSRRSSQDSQDSPSPGDRARSPVQEPTANAWEPPRYRVVIVGAGGVGKTSLLHQFTTSEFLHAECATPDDNPCDPVVSVLLNGEEFELSFLEQHDVDVSGPYTPEPHAFCVVFSSADKQSFKIAEAVLERLWMSEVVGAKAVILVANKTDLVRGRQVTTEEGKNAASAHDCKYIETSVAINHNVDELLVGILSQIRLKLQDPEKARSIFRKRSFSRRKSLGRAAWRAGSEDTETGLKETPVNPAIGNGSAPTKPEGSALPRKLYRGSKTSASFRMKSLLDKVLARDSKAKSCDKLHVL